MGSTEDEESDTESKSDEGSDTDSDEEESKSSVAIGAIVPSAESLESFERLVVRRREKNRIKREKGIYRRILESDVNEFKLVKFLLHFPFGLIFGYALFKISVDRLNFGSEFAIQVAVIFIVAFAGCFSIYVTFRCLAVLLLPHLFGEVGRLYIYTICASVIIAGPLANFVMNVGETLRSIGCQFEVFVNLTLSRVSIRLMPLLGGMMDIVGNQADLQKMASDLITSLEPILKEVIINEDTNRQIAEEILSELSDIELGLRLIRLERRYMQTGQESRLKRIQMEYMHRLELTCERVLSAGVRTCAKSFKKGYEMCVNKLSVVISWACCWVFKLTFFCNVFKEIPNRIPLDCTSWRYVDDKFSAVVKTIDDLMLSLQKQFEANMQYEDDEVAEWVDEEEGVEENEKGGESEGVGYVTNSVLWQFNVKKAAFYIVFQILRRLLVLIFVFLIYRSQHYLQLYLTSIDFDNRYITEYFKRIDARRKVEVKRTLLPLKKLEMREIAYGCSLRMTDDERSDMFRSIVRAVVLALVFTSLLFTDYILAEIMDFVSSIARVDYTQTGRHHVSLNLKGTGVIAKILRTIFNGFNHTEYIDNIVSNKDCMPTPYRTTWTEQVTCYLCIAGVFATAILEVQVMRTRRLICDFFYPKRHKARVIFLYNDMLRKRVGFLHEARHKVRKKCKKDQFYVPLSFLTSLRYQFPGYCEWLRKLGLGRQNCLICNDKEDGYFIHCPTFKCKATYCRQCWIDVNGRCYACRDDDDWTVVSSGGGSKVALQDARSPWKGPGVGPAGERFKKKKKTKQKW